MCGMCEAAFGRGSVQQCLGCVQAQGYVDDEESLQLLLRWTSAFCKVLMWHVREECDLESELQVCHAWVVLATRGHRVVDNCILCIIYGVSQ